MLALEPRRHSTFEAAEHLRRYRESHFTDTECLREALRIMVQYVAENQPRPIVLVAYSALLLVWHNAHNSPKQFHVRHRIRLTKWATNILRMNT